ncbi:hypothetical protein IEQ34_023151 [Dendrobium chrysotoxum]|uniref:Uncharacterized protein n=1 Tax=Dendrobium chrysotoxum TaxID=161865 RepID=A0AAV7FZF8_DENCH|nr:hypothetical protein IEQ34_023151 [Dendrobium chrysotoxum]
MILQHFYAAYRAFCLIELRNFEPLHLPLSIFEDYAAASSICLVSISLAHSYASGHLRYSNIATVGFNYIKWLVKYKKFVSS